MVCPYCKSDVVAHVISAPIEIGDSIKRKRLCPVCKKRFTTIEEYELPGICRTRVRHNKKGR